MNICRYTKESFAVIGREGSTADGAGFVQRLWHEANTCYAEVSGLAKLDENGAPVGFWGAMTDFSRTFRPWEEHFSKGLYLAGVECREDAEPPVGWVKWIVPGYEYLRVECDQPDVFTQMVAYMDESHIQLVGAVQDYICPQTGKNFMLFPIREL